MIYLENFPGGWKREYRKSHKQIRHSQRHDKQISDTAQLWGAEHRSDDETVARDDQHVDDGKHREAGEENGVGPTHRVPQSCARSLVQTVVHYMQGIRLARASRESHAKTTICSLLLDSN